MVAAGAAMGFVGMIENAWYNGKLIQYSPWQQLWNITPITLITLIVSAISYFIAGLAGNIGIKITIGCISFGGLYLMISFFMHAIPEELISLAMKAKNGTMQKIK